MPIAKSLLNILLIAAAGYGLLVALMYFAQRALMYPGASIAGPAPSTAPWGEAQFVDTPDGERLYALHSPAGEDRPTLLFFHGNGDTITQYGFLADGLARHEIGLLALSYRGFTGSSGRPGEAGLHIDARTGFDWLAARTEGPILLLGQSLGSGVALRLAAGNPGVDGVILVSAYDSVENLAASIYFFLPVRWLIRDRFRSDLWIDRVTQPKLFVHGVRDAVVPIRHGQALYEAAPEPKEMLVYDAYGHNDIWTDGLLGDVVRFTGAVVEGTAAGGRTDTKQ